MALLLWCCILLYIGREGCPLDPGCGREVEKQHALIVQSYDTMQGKMGPNIFL